FGARMRQDDAGLWLTVGRHPQNPARFAEVLRIQLHDLMNVGADLGEIDRITHLVIRRRFRHGRLSPYSIRCIAQPRRRVTDWTTERFTNGRTHMKIGSLAKMGVHFASTAHVSAYRLFGGRVAMGERTLLLTTRGR